MTNWLNALNFNPVPRFLELGDEALVFFVNRDLLDDPHEPVESIWACKGAEKCLKKQLPDGAWKYRGSGPKKFPYINYNLLETYRNLRVLVEQYGFDRRHPAIQKAADFIFSCQTKEGDIRGILGNQYMPYYHGAILELLIKAGYAPLSQVTDGMNWLLTVRQYDGGWVVPMQLIPTVYKTETMWRGHPVPADWSKPLSHIATGMVLRSFAAHPYFKNHSAARFAGDALKTRFFKPDRYNDRKATEYWTKFQFPFWWPNLLTALDSLSLLGYSREDPCIQLGLEWFLENQEPDGVWPIGYENGKKAEEQRIWVGLAVCRVFKRFFEHAVFKGKEVNRGAAAPV